MSVRQIKKIAQRSFEHQQNESDCGVAALSSIIQFHKGYIPLEKLRSLSGTTASGTTMLGLLQAGNEVGLETEAFEGTVDELKKISSPTLLHILKHDVIEHYIVCYAFDGKNFLIGDPADGIKVIDSQCLDRLWKSKALLTFSKTEGFTLKRKINIDKYAWIRKSIMADRQLAVSTLLIGIAVASLNFSTAIFTEKLVDNLIPSQNPGTIVLGLIAWLSLMTFKSAFTYLREIILIKQALRLNIRLTGHFIQKLIQLPKSFFDSRKKGDLIARLFDTGRVQTSIGVIISQDIIDILTLVVAITFVQFYQATVALFLIILIPVYFMIVYNYYSKIYRANKQVMSSYAHNEAYYIDTLTGIEAIKQQLKEVSETNALLKHFRKFQENVVSVERIGANFKVVTDAFGLLSMFLILTYCVTSVLNNSIQLGDMLAIFSISVIALGSTNRLAYAVTHLQEAKAALDRTYDIVSLSSEPSTGIDINDAKIIQVHNVSFRFPGHQLLFEGVDFSIKKGEITVLLGENGSGKSTILQILQKFYSPETGSIYFDDKNIKDINPKSLRRLIGVVPQHVKIFNHSLGFNISLSHEIYETEIIDFCETHGLMEFVNTFREGVHSVLGEEGINVSGGQRQLIALARALFNKPQFLFLDEFTSSMDKETESLALSIIKAKKETGILIITHNPKLTSSIATTKYHLNDGQIHNSN